MKIVLLDTDVLVYIVEQLYDANKTVFTKVFSLLVSEYKQCWIPGTVRKEFLTTGRKKRYRKLSRRLNKLAEKYPIIACPIRIPGKEVQGLLKDIDPGEADAILQAKKAISKYEHYQILFMTNDKTAQLSSLQMDVACLPYKDFKDRLKEAGIAIPF